MPVRSPRRLYLLDEITVNLDDDPNAVDSPGGTTRPIIAKIKEGIGDYLGLTALEYNDPIFTGVFGGNGSNAGSSFRRNLGGFKVASYKLIAESFFTINEEYYNDDNEFIATTSNFKSISIGMPKGHSVTEVIAWLQTTTRMSEIQSLVTPAGHKVDLFTV